MFLSPEQLVPEDPFESESSQTRLDLETPITLSGQTLTFWSRSAQD